MLHSTAWELWWLAAMPGLGNLRFSQAIIICQGAYMQLVCVYLHKHGILVFIMNKQPFGTCLCLRLIRVIASSVAHLWLPALNAHFFPIQPKALKSI